jgi:hypothetical protein
VDAIRTRVCGLDLPDSGCRRVSASREPNVELSGSIKGKEILDRLSDLASQEGPCWPELFLDTFHILVTSLVK